MTISIMKCKNGCFSLGNKKHRLSQNLESDGAIKEQGINPGQNVPKSHPRILRLTW